ncbi:MAG TPA: beta-ketoacyl synthase N-terminal-like domain-containing protein, partial [Candidatus Contendobacter sp.]|nr:beta-ketoacyl synthase N-terminal-like domain-containing protein [Candidatus Contendobacter sp.]
MRRVVITGIGIVSSIGNDRREVLESLRQGRSGLEFAQDYKDMGLRSHVRGPVRVNLAEQIDRKILRFMGDAAAFTYIALREAIADAGLPEEMVSSPRTGLVAGTGGGSPQNMVEAADLLRNKGLKRVGPYMVPRTMSSTTTACLATP